ncbi:TIGR03086 family metal-binding protein [Streptomyces sp. TRM 70351]|uniref:TIGR03086 family metal-binding protein n=1 Tax=Streptomyces sp. TRM 70351 TaxID=3116552 RepID=UPI002E7C2D30|nr:TIGR03086 family metal-binding protein [Streptomyces sp. TRM 70351]MEE1929643.1 TIGR03086 family metal-binding protein [Streptomyces sp. TRM 70351]
MELLEAFDRSYEAFDQRVLRVEDEQWTAGTPCTEWTVRDVVNHVVSEHLWAPWLLRGATLAEVGDRFDGDVLGGDPKGAWARAAAASRPAFHRPAALSGTVNTSGGPSPADAYAWQMTLDLAVHGWDVARGIGADEHMDQELARTLLERFGSQIPQWQGSGLFGPSVDVPGSASARDRLLALLGRRP